MLILRLGDPHVKPTNIKESDHLMDFILDKYRLLKADRLEILGDLFDTHNIVRLEVLQFWEKWFRILQDNNVKTVVLRGNHDVSGDYSNDYSALNTLDRFNNEYLHIITKPTLIGSIGYLPYIHYNKEFVESANSLVSHHGVKCLVSHTTYQGSKFDSGMYAPDGVDPDLLSHSITNLISGHVHAEQEFGRVWYPGTARWLSKSCANRTKGIWLCTHDDYSGAMTSKEFISTHQVCTPIISLQWKEGQEKPEFPLNAKIDVELVGSSEWVTSQKKDLKGVSISSKITDTKKSRERKSGKSLHEFLSNHYQTEPEKRQKLIKYLEGLNLVG